MTTTTIKLLQILSSILVLSTTISARPGLPFHPCNTLIISSFSFSLPNPNNPNNPRNPSNPNSEIILRFLPRSRLFPDRTQIFHPTLVTDLPFRHYRPFHLTRSEMTDLPLHLPRPEMTDLPLGFTSIRDRTKDILSVVASLLFGAACGALTAGTMYLIWSLFNYRHGSYLSIEGFSSDDDDNDDDNDIFNPKKSHYVAIPAVAPVKETDASVVAKETV